ncbi:hypothetical protein [Planctomycetes bacterium K23_9]|uniref:Uncharacterized protein n=1 Tax=Stieleria marina TaxID=1930275 RepID=A0A517P2S6_9BACT|nr:hypothetical protein K239x_56680 [Planctomycetes bacterium K23_9]
MYPPNSLDTAAWPARRSRTRRIYRGAGWLALGLFVLTGCSKDEMKKMATSVQQTTQDLAAQSQDYIQGAVEAVEEQLPSTGSLSLRIEPPLEIESANVEIIKIGDGRSNVVQLATYDTDSGPSSYPSVLLHGQTAADSPAALAGQTVGCDLYVQQSSGGAILMSPPGSSVQVTFGQFDQESGTLKASVGSSRLISSDRSKVNLNGGNVVAVIRGAGN